MLYMFILLSCFTGCSKISSLASVTDTEAEYTGDPVYDSQTEMRLLI